MFRSYKPSVKHSYTIRIAYTTCRNNSESIPDPKQPEKKKRSFAHFCARFADFLRPFAFLVFSEMAQKCPKVLRNVVRIGCPKVSELGARIRCPKVSELGTRIGCLIGVLIKCQHHACLALANEHSRSPTIYYCAPKVVFGSHMVVDHVSGTCGFAICGMIFEEFCRYRKIFASGHVSFNGSRSNRSRSDTSSVICGSFSPHGQETLNWILHGSIWMGCMHELCMHGCEP